MGRDKLLSIAGAADKVFQSTLPAWGETYDSLEGEELEKLFQSTLPAWGETRHALRHEQHGHISIHSPRMGRDLLFIAAYVLLEDISIHSPRMGRDLRRITT